MKKLSSQPYKGVRDFYPEQMKIQNYLFDTMRQVAEEFGYQEYTASLLEETNIYRAKTGEEIVNEQTYSFIDRGGRDVTLRPEMTPTVARMVAARRRNLSFPVRWYSIPNCFRYERPQRGRMREFWQLNVDLLGSTSLMADIEIIQVAYKIMKKFGVADELFTIRINSRKLMYEVFNSVLQLDGEKSYRLSKLIDRKDKVGQEEFINRCSDLLGNKNELFQKFINAKTIQEIPTSLQNLKSFEEIKTAMLLLGNLGINNALFDPGLMRGFDYYTGVVFEIYDTGNENNRALFGGGRYDNLVDIFGVESVPAVGFGMGDLPIQQYLETYDLLSTIPTTSIIGIICDSEINTYTKANKLAEILRAENVYVCIDYGDKKMGDKFKRSKKSGITWVIYYDKADTLRLRNLVTQEELIGTIGDFIKKIKNI